VQHLLRGGPRRLQRRPPSADGEHVDEPALTDGVRHRRAVHRHQGRIVRWPAPADSGRSDVRSMSGSRVGRHPERLAERVDVRGAATGAGEESASYSRSRRSASRYGWSRGRRAARRDVLPLSAGSGWSGQCTDHAAFTSGDPARTERPESVFASVQSRRRGTRQKLARNSRSALVARRKPAEMGLVRT
jgi:hypothetical protein